MYCYLHSLYYHLEHLASIISSLPPSAHKSFTSVPRRRLSAPRHITRTILSQLNEAEIADNPSQVRWLLSVLRNRELLPAKILIFREDARPGYFGTWTRHSRIIGPRTPFARDPVTLDYAYDSGEEWEEEGTGDADDVDEGAEEDDGATEADSDLDSWLVDDDVEEIGTPLEERGAEPLSAVLNFPVKRKAEGGERKIDKKRKIVVPLVPFAKGPCWESDVGQCTYEPFEPYRIQLFNGGYLWSQYATFVLKIASDTPYPIDPFTFISAPQGKIQKILKETSSTVSPTFAIPFLPDRLVATSGTTPTAAASTSSTATTAPSATTKRTSSTATPKTSFPEAHLPILVSKINALATSNITFLVESIYQDLRTHKVKKNAIEAKVKEVGEKCKEKKVWIVKPGVAVCSFSAQFCIFIELICRSLRSLKWLHHPKSAPSDRAGPSSILPSWLTVLLLLLHTVTYKLYLYFLGSVTVKQKVVRLTTNTEFRIQGSRAGDK